MEVRKGMAATVDGTALQQEQNDLLRRQTEAQEKALQSSIDEKVDKLNETSRLAEEKRKGAVANANVKFSTLNDDINELGEKVNKVSDWEVESDLEVGRAMRAIKSWKEDLDKIVTLNRVLKEIVIKNDISGEEISLVAADALVNNVSDEVWIAVKAIESQDDYRALFTLDTTKQDPIKLPSFEGKDDEDFSVFKENMEKAFVQNRTCKADQLAKLKECLKGHAKRMVPDSITKTVEEAWADLDKAFGDPERLLKHRLESLFRLGTLPSSNVKGGFKKQIDWYLQAESLIRGVIVLGKTDEELDRAAFSSITINAILRLFPQYQMSKLSECHGKGQYKLEAIAEKISAFRLKAQDLQKVNEEPISFAAGNESGSGAGGAIAGSGGVGGGKKPNQANNVITYNEMPALAMYKPPRRDDKCRICSTLEAEGDTSNLYDNHLNSFPTGCPRYIGMRVDQRFNIAAKAKFCLKCHDPEYIYKPKDPKHKCLITPTKKSRYTCTGKDGKCLFHMWTCCQHKNENEEGLKKFKEEINQRFNLDFAYVASLPGRGSFDLKNLQVRKTVRKNHSSGKRPVAAKVAEVTKKNEAMKATRRKSLHKPKEVNIPEVSSQVKDVMIDITSPEVVISVTDSNHKSLSTAEAAKKLKKKLSAAGGEVELRPIPKGKAQFMIGQTEGKTRPLLTLYDSGCGGLLLREGVPQKELTPAVLKTKGPYIVNGVGDTAVQVNDEWMCSLSLRDGSRQAVEGWTVDKITATLPSINMTQAEAEIKADKKNNEQLKNLKVEPVIGGDVDLLLGILYNGIFPVAVHSLTSGLTIYELQITSHKKSYNSVIGGPHESFQYLAQQAGSMNIVFAQLVQQLETYKQFGAPKLSNSLMSSEDLEFAMKFKEWEIENVTKHSLLEVDMEMCRHESVEELSIPTIEKPGLKELEEPLFDNVENVLRTEEISCYECGNKLSKEKDSPAELLMNWSEALPVKTDEEEDENLKALRKIHQAQQEGLQIEYRCPRCRSCSDCRRSFETERVSLREEAEDLMIWDSVVIDWEKRRIICHLPLRGAEEEFLSNNRDMALKILDQQCFKYFKDDETREVIVKAFDKLLKNNQIVLWKNLTEDQKKTIEEQSIQHYIPWRVVFKHSISTPARPVFDASTNTKHNADGSAGRCLNDLLIKGRVVTLNLLKMLLRFMVGSAAVQGDLKQFYASILLVLKQWNLQRIVFRKNLDPNGEVLEAVIKTLIWGVKPVSAQSECAIIKLAEFVKADNPILADFLINCRFVDDLGGSDKDVESLKKLTKEADELFEKVSLSCKGWTYSGSDPPEDVSEDGNTVSIGGTRWHAKLDLLEIPFPLLHFSRKSRGRLVVGTQVFEGKCLEDMDKFVPKTLTRRMIFSKNASIFDLPGKFAPIMADFKVDLRAAAKQTKGWDDGVSVELRSKWVRNFWRLETLRGIKFQRARMPENAVSSKMNMIVAVDAAEQIKVVGAWGRFRLDSGDFSCQQLMGRSLLAEEDSTIPKNELEAMTMGSNLGWILRQSLESWIDSFILIGDSTITICWVTSEKKRLGLFHRNRCAQIRRGTEVDLIYHVISECNPADLGTRPAAVLDSDVGPNSKWEKGLPWMRGEIDDAIEQGILTPAAKLRIKDEEDEETYNKGFVFEKSPEILTRGHPAILLSTRAEKVLERSKFSDYPLLPTKYKFEKVVRIYALINKFLRSFKCLKGKFQQKNPNQFKMLSINMIEAIKIEKIEYKKTLVEELSEDVPVANQNFGAKKSEMQFTGKYHINLSEENISWGLNFLFTKATEEVKEFHKADFLRKIAVEKNGILFCKSRILDCQRFQVAGGLEEFNILEDLGIKVMTPVLDRHSPLSYAVGDYIHRKLAKHGGYENCFRLSLQHCFIIQGVGLFRELGDACVFCAKKREKYLEAPMGPISDKQLMIAPAFWITMMDIYGPCHVYVPGHAMMTRHRKVVEAKCYVLVFACPTTKLVNLQVIESKSADGVIDGVTRLCCEIGVPSFILVDQDSGILKVLKEAEVNVRDLEFVLHKEKGIKFKTCPVSGHNYHGAIERKIRTVQQCLDRSGVDSLRLHATGLQTFCKLAENDMNNLPLGYSYGKDSDNSPLLKLIFPNMLKVGRINSRALEGPIRMPKGPGELMKKVEKAYEAFFKIWNITMIPKLMKMNKWFDSKSQLQVGDIVYFQKVENELSSRWTVGRITEVTKSQDNVVRRADVQYQNAGEDIRRTTDRAARSLVKLFNIDDCDWQSEMAEIEKLIFDLKRKEDETDATAYTMNHTGEGLRYRLIANSGYDSPKREVGVQYRPGARMARSKLLSPCKDCCCFSHCQLNIHEKDAKMCEQMFDVQEYNFADMLDRSWVEFSEYHEELIEEYATENDDFMAMLCSVNTDLGGEDDVLYPGDN